jgi:hypothetical protein
MGMGTWQGSFGGGLRGRMQRMGTLWVLVPVLVAMLFFVVFFDVSHRMVTSDGPTVAQLQRSFTVANFRDVVCDWGDGIDAFKRNLLTLDFVYPVLYAVALSSLFALANGLQRPTKTELFFFALPWGAALLDWIENTAHLWLLADVHDAAGAAAADFSAPMVMTASVAAMLKFAGILASAGAAAVWGFRRRRYLAAALGVVLFAAFVPALFA